MEKTDIELVIKIPEEIYSRIMLGRSRIHTFDNEIVCDAIKNGTLLPLIDADNREEAISHLKDILCENNTVKHSDMVIFEQEKEALRMAIKALECESCEDEYVKVPKKALKYRTAGMVAYNAEWLKDHFDIERAVICGVQEPRIDVLDLLSTARIYAGAEFERLCNNNQHIDACVFQSVRDSIAQNIQLLQSYAICKAESEE